MLRSYLFYNHVRINTERDSQFIGHVVINEIDAQASELTVLGIKTGTVITAGFGTITICRTNIRISIELFVLIRIQAIEDIDLLLIDDKISDFCSNVIVSLGQIHGLHILIFHGIRQGPGEGHSCSQFPQTRYQRAGIGNRRAEVYQQDEHRKAGSETCQRADDHLGSSFSFLLVGAIQSCLQPGSRLVQILDHSLKLIFSIHEDTSSSSSSRSNCSAFL